MGPANYPPTPADRVSPARGSVPRRPLASGEALERSVRNANSMNLPNRLTVARVALTPVVPAVMLGDWPGWQVASILLISFLALTDLLDGWLARRWNQITPLGVLLDPIADKFFISTVFICLVARGCVRPGWPSRSSGASSRSPRCG